MDQAAQNFAMASINMVKKLIDNHSIQISFLKEESYVRAIEICTFVKHQYHGHASAIKMQTKCYTRTPSI